VLILCFVLTGCSSGGSDLPELAPVSGVITLQGKPLQNAQVTFVPQSGRPSNGTTDAEGRYELYYKAGVPGAVTGKHTVQITVEENMELPKNQQTVIPAKYNTRSTLEATITGTEPAKHDFDLKI
tara:strand:- start:1143 stop:1517 length:375 start_codon:yes stop_codon:yes gene_type:complete